MASAAFPPTWRTALTSGTSMVAGTIVAANALRILSTIILTRALSPADFGVAGITAAILVVMGMISDFGFGVYIVQHPRGDEPRLLDIVWTVRLVRSALLTLILLVLAGPIAGLLDKPAMHAVIVVTAFQFVIEGISSLAPLSAIRRQRLAMLSLLDIVTAVSQTVIGILLALLLHNYWAIVIGGLIGTALRSVLSYLLFPGSRRRFGYDRAEVTAMWRFGRTVAGAHTIQVLLSNFDKFALSRLVPFGVFGLYVLASNLSGAPSAFTQLYPNRVLLPAYADALRRGSDVLAAVYYAGRRWVMLLYLVAMGGFIAMAPAVIHLLYDPRYADAARYMQILSIAPAFALNNYAAREVLIVAGRVRTLLIANLVRLGWLLAMGTAGFLIAGPIGLVAAVGLIEIPVMLYCWYELGRIGVFRIGEELLMLAALGFGLLMGVGGNELYFLLFGGG
ncbi:oligosaccharide flippase family protein [Sphingomonas prati]|uniref:O-antigen/teichoic acid export membrane protein n=1 Tax=Sphingomonas prati TaxID=1843237 RepID=A0A7W9BTH8_9SPHN|nr:oligosaccharide flippase family protein [Sphingomonas prati]MBB5729700.1 O-antigen/teichoic acid export membrane protein [Sphingomonas prati]GGE90148.1 lipopolysaccharide biosynthesis protein [Sphingomonas prati]